MSGRVTPILQFGTSRFLQAHALALFQAGEGTAPAVTVVQTTSDPGRRARLAALAAPGGYPVQIRGLENGQPVQRQEQVHLVARALSYDEDLDEITRIATTEARWILSNTADRGFDPLPADGLPHSAPGQSYPAKLYHLLAARHRAGGGPVVMLPTELIARNGECLKARVLEIAAQNGAAPDLIAALNGHIWVNSLVDRIVSEPLSPAGAVAEPYALWAIEDQPGLALPARHPAIRVVPSLEPYEKLKLHILNLGHTVLVDLWDQAGRPCAFVREAVSGPLRPPLLAVLTGEVLPGFAKRGMGDEAKAYLDQVLERFANPFLDHRLEDIAQNHPAKIRNRITAFLDWAGLSADEAPRLTDLSRRA